MTRHINFEFSKKIYFLIFISLMIFSSGCVTDESSQSIALPEYKAEEIDEKITQNKEIENEEKMSKFSDDVNIALLLPFSASSKNAQNIADHMYKSVEQALFELGNPKIKLFIYDTRGDPTQAAKVAKKAVENGANFILGPLYSSSIKSVGAIASQSNVKQIAFSSDRRNLGEGRYLFSFPDELEIARVIDHSVLNDLSKFGLLIPQGRFGDRLLEVVTEELYIRGAQLVASERYGKDSNAMGQAVKRLAQRVKRKNTSTAPTEGEDGKSAEVKDNRYSEYNYAINALIIPEEGSRIERLLPHLPFNDLHPNIIKYIGLSGWGDANRKSNSLLKSAWYAAPDPQTFNEFIKKYENTHGFKPHNNAVLAYDAMLIIGKLAKNPANDRFSHQQITDKIGYYGASGLFRITDDGWVDRGLAVIEINNGRLKIIDPAPISFLPGT